MDAGGLEIPGELGQERVVLARIRLLGAAAKVKTPMSGRGQHKTNNTTSDTEDVLLVVLLDVGDEGVVDNSQVEAERVRVQLGQPLRTSSRRNNQHTMSRV
jgi:hypothetical protein